MSQIEKTLVRVTVLTLGILAFQACGNAFKAKQPYNDSSSLSSISGGGSGGITIPGLTGGTGGTTTLPNLTAIVSSLGNLMSFVGSLNIQSPQALLACTNFSGCTGSGPTKYEATYNCSRSGSAMTGTTDLTFNGNYCLLDSSQMVATPNITFTSSSQSVNLSSASHADYNGVSYGGGANLNYSLSGATLSFLGLSLVGGGLDVSIHSAAASTLTISTSGANLTGGQLVISDNNAHLSANVALDNLAFGTSCACPTSGSVSGSLSGAVSANVTLTFTSSCGQATVSVPSFSYSSSVSIPGC